MTSRELSIYGYIAAVFYSLYALVGLILPPLRESPNSLQETFFGFSQLFFLKQNPIIALFSILLIALSFYSSKQGWFAALNIEKPTVRILIAALSFPFFFLLRSNFLNPDGLNLVIKFKLLGERVSLDEVYELYTHWHFWNFTNTQFGWSVELSYQVLSCFAGSLFIFLLLTYSLHFFKDQPALYALLFTGGGFIQLFFGDVENYTLTTALHMGYFLAAGLYLDGKIRIFIPSSILAVSTTFHLLSGFLLPSLAILYYIEWKRNGVQPILIAGMIFILIGSSTITYFHYNGFPLPELWGRSHANNVKVSELSGRYYFDLVNLAFLLSPSWVFLIPMSAYKRIRLDSVNLHLIAACAGMSILVLFWKAQLGVYNDWNLFAPAALPFSLLTWRNISQTDLLHKSSSPIRVLTWVFLIHSLAWIMLNHFNPPPVH